MDFSLRHFLLAILFGFLVSFQVIASSDQSDSEEIGPPNHGIYGGVEEGTNGMPWLPIHDTLLEDLNKEYNRAKCCGRFFDVSSDVLNVIGNIGMGVTTGLAYVGAAFDGGYWSLAAGLTGTASGAILIWAKSSDVGVKSKLSDMRDILTRIVTLQWRQHNLGGEDSHESTDEV